MISEMQRLNERVALIFFFYLELFFFYVVGGVIM
jgi:hypothetical protein